MNRRTLLKALSLFPFLGKVSFAQRRIEQITGIVACKPTINPGRSNSGPYPITLDTDEFGLLSFDVWGDVSSIELGKRVWLEKRKNKWVVYVNNEAQFLSIVDRNSASKKAVND